MREPIQATGPMQAMSLCQKLVNHRPTRLQQDWAGAYAAAFAGNRAYTGNESIQATSLHGTLGANRCTHLQQDWEGAYAGNVQTGSAGAR